MRDVVSKQSPQQESIEEGEMQSIISWFAHIVPRIRQMEDDMDFWLYVK